MTGTAHSTIHTGVAHVNQDCRTAVSNYTNEATATMHTRPVKQLAGEKRARYKRGFDLAVIAIVGLGLLPVWVPVVAAIAIAVRRTGNEGVLYRQTRLGYRRQRFEIIKFRTMTGGDGADRMTRIGAVLRATHLDELPQVLNVLRGEMSLVGPRPHSETSSNEIEAEHPGFVERLEVRPGIAGLAQARAGADIAPRNKLRYDRLYIRRMNPWLDTVLLGKCVVKGAKGLRAVAGRECAARPARSRPGRPNRDRDRLRRRRAHQPARS